jgi:pyruvate/oxaloacetate carboxyltransferase
MSESVKSTETITLIVCITIAVCSIVVGAFLYNINDRNNMAKNIEAAIQKGVDPISVKCSYESSPTSTCIAYSMSLKK